MEDKEIKNISKRVSLDVIISFLLLEVLVLISFNLTGNIIFFSSLMIVILGLLVILTFKQIKTDGISSFAMFLIPLFAFALLSVISHFTDAKTSLVNPIQNRIFAVLGIFSFASVGFLTSYTRTFKLKTVLLGIYIALGVYVLINLFLTMVQFSAFYTITHKDYYFYYNGDMSTLSIGEMAYCLIGFASTETSLEYFSLFPTILSTAVAGLFFINPKEDKRTFVIYAVAGAIGIITLILTPSIMTLITDFLLIVVCLFVVLAGKVNFNLKKVKTILSIAGIVLGVLFLLFILNAQNGVSFLNPLQNLISGNAFLNKLFNANPLSRRYKAVIGNLFNTSFWFGFQPGYYMVNGEEQAIFSSGSSLFDILMISGLFGEAFFIVGLVIGIKSLINFYRNSNEGKAEKSLVLAYIFALLAYSLFNYNSLPFAFSDATLPLYMVTPFLIGLFFVGYSFSVSKPKEEVKDEK